ncbi:MAG TPA: hemerythrin domain-containing protein [Ramlibacter sp.]|nr:hemerythrin domain-containing protein [Ramlibacter sp.]
MACRACRLLAPAQPPDEQLTRIHEDTKPDFELMLDIVSYLRQMGDRAHHRLEDAAFERLVLRDPALCLPVNRLKQEHRAIAAAGEELATLLNEALGDAVVLRSAVETAAALYLVYYRHHLATEEKSIMPRAAKLLTDEDWKAVSRAVPQDLKPLPEPVRRE